MRAQLPGIATLILFILARGAPAGEERDVDCGVRCLYTGLRALGAALGTYAEFRQEIGEPGLNGYSLQQLEATARKHGVQTRSVMTNLDHLRERKESYVCMTFLPEQHFVLLSNVENGKVTIIDPPRVLDLPRDTFSSRWNRKCLLLSRTMLASEEYLENRLILKRLGYDIVAAAAITMPVFLVVRMLLKWRRKDRVLMGLAFAILLGGAGCGDSSPSARDSAVALSNRPRGIVVRPERLELGIIEPDDSSETRMIAFQIVNQDNCYHRIYQVVTSCLCTDVSLEKTYIESNSFIRATARIKPGHFNEKRQAYIFLETDATDTPRIEVIVEWETKTSIYTDSEKIEVLGVHQSQRVVEERDLYCRGTLDCLRNCTVMVTSLNRLASAEFYPDKNHEHNNNSNKKQRCGVVSVALPESKDPGFFSDMIRIHATRGEKSYSLELPITWTIAEKYPVSPRRLSLERLSDGTLKKKHIIITSSNGKAFSVRSVRTRFRKLDVCASFERSPGSVHGIDLRFDWVKRSASDGADELEISLVSDGVNDLVVIPVSVFLD